MIYSGLGDVFVWLAIWKVDNGDWSTGDLYSANEQTRITLATLQSTKRIHRRDKILYKWYR